MATKNQTDLPGLTLQQVLRMTPNRFRDRGLNTCTITAKQYGSGSREGFARSRVIDPTWYNEMRITSRCTGTQRYSYIRFFGPPVPNSPVWVWCSCPHFAFNVEWVLAQYGSSSISQGYENRGIDIIDAPPIVRNKSKLPYLCKHLILCASEALKQTRDYAAEAGATAVWQKKYPGEKKPSYEDKKPSGPQASNKIKKR